MYPVNVASAPPIDYWASSFSGSLPPYNQVEFNTPRDLGPGPKQLTSLNTPFMKIKDAPINPFGVRIDDVTKRTPLSMSYGVQPAGTFYQSLHRTNMYKNFDPPSAAHLEAPLFETNPLAVVSDRPPVVV